MKDENMPSLPEIIFVPYLPDLITEADYREPLQEQKIRLRIQTTEQGIQVLGDSIYATLLEDIMAKMEPSEIERMLCG